MAGCEGCVGAGFRAKWEAQCFSREGEPNDDGSYTCLPAPEGTVCPGGWDSGCYNPAGGWPWPDWFWPDSQQCVHGAGGPAAHPLGGDEDASDAVLPVEPLRNTWLRNDTAMLLRPGFSFVAQVLCDHRDRYPYVCTNKTWSPFWFVDWGDECTCLWYFFMQSTTSRASNASAFCSNVGLIIICAVLRVST